MASAPFRLTLGSLGAALAAATACAEGVLGASHPVDGGGGPNVVGEGGVTTSDAGPPTTTMRLAHLAPDLGAVDFCYRPAKSSSFEGPVLDRGAAGPKSDAAAADADAASDADAGSQGLAYASVSTYTTLAVAGPLTIALVPAGASSCAGAMFVADVTLDPGKLSTVAVLGRRDADAADGLGLVAFIDDHETLAKKARVRFVHAASGTSVPIAVRAVGAQAVLTAERIEPRRVAAASPSIPVDDLGYATIQPLPPPTSLAIAPVAAQDAAAGGWQTAASDLGLVGGSLHTGFVLSGAANPFEVLWCTDTSTTVARTTCLVVR